jgi:hypothetical protein
MYVKIECLAALQNGKKIAGGADWIWAGFSLWQ